MVVSEPKGRGGMPIWAKILIGVLAVGALGTACLVAFFVWAAGKFKESVNPEKASQVAHEMVEIREPLPTGWGYVMGMDMGGYKLASLMNKRDQTFIQFMQLPNAKHLTSKQLSESPEFAASQGNSGLSKFERVSSGDETIGGQKMYYAVGKTHTAQGDAYMEMGFVVLPSGKTIAVQVIEHDSTTFDPALAKPIFDNIASFPDTPAKP